MAVDASPTPATELTADSPCHSPYITAPSSPKHSDDFSSGIEASPDSRGSPDGDHPLSESPSAIPFTWEERPGKPKPVAVDDDFAFDFSGHLNSDFLSADELFDGGVIRPLKPPPRLRPSPELSESTRKGSGREPFSLRKRMFPSRESIDFDPFEAAMESTRSEHNSMKTSSFMGLSCSAYSLKSCRKWRLKDLLSFRGSARVKGEDPKNGSFRSSRGSGSGSQRRFQENQPGSEEKLEREAGETTPYRQGLLGCMGFNHYPVHGLVKSMETVPRG
ncbi:uncharacterized protein LOC131158889 [Malania oleifera]|uniref:uncharacterized protein LOC131158889 n=1 Tax=Malania oleifera TaxID=397392 RepID=UPI0025ADCA48|nr:uncharacterized protein LOC131158889 [Malania oleifera]